ncbi:MAG: hypothetical protein A2W91_06520 [Bacteroidetes bacterium GWF2_38_335]|nr:MAG: hypothetical protein A2W91_06520 [Bacteroidetes bacterium GWF2_38_335]OFY77687.1 MAG: hypothetical protein A2281_18035 [Bacteroidetes bacterium RIFOXYA12_FULL_38_20]HBS89084.1 hypothetical protein [Bacteroidales bacterium]
MYFRKISVFGYSILATACLPACRNESDVTEKKSLDPIINDAMPNIVLILVDDVGFDKVGYSSGNKLTPNIDQLAADGVIYNNAYTSSAICTPSRYSLLTGKFPGRCTDITFVENSPDNDPYLINWNSFLSKSDYTIFEALSENGYQTGFVGKYHLASKSELDACLPALDSSLIPADADKYLRIHQDSLVSLIKRKTGADFVDNVHIGNCEENLAKWLKTHHTEWTTYGACSFIENAKDDKPFFLYLATNLTHGPGIIEGFENDPVYTPEGKVEDVMKYSLPKDKVKNQMLFKANWKDENKLAVVLLDNQIGDIINALKRKGCYDQSMIIFVSDNNNEPGKGSCYESGIKVPMLIKWPQNQNSGMKDNRLIENVDIFPTILQMCLFYYAEGNIDGKSFLEPESKRDGLYFEAGYTRALRYGKYKYIAFRYPDFIKQGIKDGLNKLAPNHMGADWIKQAWFSAACYPGYWDQDQLYDLEKDPFELVNLAGKKEYKKVLLEMKNRIDCYLKTFRNEFSVQNDNFMESNEYKRAVDNSKKEISRAIGPENIRIFNQRHLMLR